MEAMSYFCGYTRKKRIGDLIWMMLNSKVWMIKVGQSWRETFQKRRSMMALCRARDKAPGLNGFNIDFLQDF